MIQAVEYYPHYSKWVLTGYRAVLLQAALRSVVSDDYSVTRTKRRIGWRVEVRCIVSLPVRRPDSYGEAA